MENEMFTTKEAIQNIAELAKDGTLFGIRTEIGTIVIQMLFKDVDFFNPIEVYPWKDAPRNDYVRECDTSGERYDYYVIFGAYNKPSETYRYIYAAEIMSRIWIMKLKENNSQDNIDAKTYIFIKKHLKLNITQHDLFWEMKRCLYGKKNIDDNTQKLLSYYLSSRLNKAKLIL